MAGQSRTLKLSILADVDQLKKSLNTGSNEVEGFGSKIEGFGSKAKLAFAAAGVAAAAYAGKLLIDGVKSAIADEAAQQRLANALRNTVGATDEAIAAAESYILKQSLATGVSDDDLRPALERLTRSTKDVAEAQKLTNLALDIAKAKNLDVTTVANALAKANDGQTGALKKLGITLGDNATNLTEYNKIQKTLEKAQLEVNFALEEYGPKSKQYISATEKVAEVTAKSNDLAMAGIDIFGELGKEFAGAAAESADTFQGKLDRLNIAFEEGKETIGAFVLDAITPLVTFVVNSVVPAVASFIDKVSGNGGLNSSFGLVFDSLKNFVLPIFEGLKSSFDKIKSAVSDNSEELKPFLNLLKTIWEFIKNNLAPLLGGAFKLALETIGTIVGGLVTGFSKLVGFINDSITAIGKFVSFVKNNPVTNFFFGASNTGAKGLKAGGGIGQTGSLANEFMGAELADNNPFFEFNGQMIRGIINPPGTEEEKAFKAQEAILFRMANPSVFGPVVGPAGNSQAANITLNVTGAIDPEGTARTIVDTLNNSFYRGTNGALNFAGN
jgi:hypothetical protein